MEQLRQNLEDHRKDLDMFKQEVGDKTISLADKIQDTKKDLSDRVVQAEARAQQQGGNTSTGSTGLEDKPGIVFGGFTGRQLAHRG